MPELSYTPVSGDFLLNYLDLYTSAHTSVTTDMLTIGGSSTPPTPITSGLIWPRYTL